MKPGLQQLIEGKRSWSNPMSPEEKAQGFKGWYVSKNLPHFDAPGTQQYVSYRLADSMPVGRRSEWLGLLHLEDDQEKLRKIEAYLDRGYGAGHLRNPCLAELVQSNWWRFDGRRYRLLAWVVMPNHVHVLIETWHVPLGEILKSWKSYTAKEANKILRLKGSFWAEDYFDRFIRDEEHLRRVVRYLENNPARAGLVRAPEDWPWSSARYRVDPGAVVPVVVHPAANQTTLQPQRGATPISGTGRPRSTHSAGMGTGCPHSEQPTANGTGRPRSEQPTVVSRAPDAPRPGGVFQ